MVEEEEEFYDEEVDDNMSCNDKVLADHELIYKTTSDVMAFEKDVVSKTEEEKKGRKRKRLTKLNDKRGQEDSDSDLDF